MMSDLDKEELEATRNMQKTADEMFEELGYIKETDDEDFIGYVYGKIAIGFIKETKEIVVVRANMQELKAINKKCEELNWLDE